MEIKNKLPLIAALLFLLAPGRGSAQEPDAGAHVSFYGVEVNGTPEEFAQGMRDKGFPDGSRYAGTWVLKGTYSDWKDVEAFILQKDGAVYGVSLFLKCKKSWEKTKEQYFALKGHLRAEYGIPECVEEFRDKYVEGGGRESLAFLKNRAQYVSRFFVDGGVVELKVAYIDYAPMHYELVVTWLDEQNTKEAGFVLPERL